MKKPASVQMITGTAFHAAMALHFRYKALTGLNLPWSDVRNEYAASFEDSLQNDCELKPNQNAEDFLRSGSVVLRKYYQTHATKITPLIIGEKPFKKEEIIYCISPVFAKALKDYTKETVEIPAVELECLRQIPGTDWNFLGYIDLIQHDRTVVDYKVTGKKWVKSKIDEDRQSSAYAFALDRPTDFQYHVNIRSEDKPDLQILSCKRTAEDIDAYITHLHSAIERITELEAGKSPKPCSGFCNEHLCSYYNTECPAYLAGLL